MQPKSLSLALSMALCLAAGTAAPSAELAQNPPHNPDGLCRRAAALPPMPPEPQVRRDQRQESREEPMLMTPVEAPPTPRPAPAPVADGASEDATDVMVTGTRVRRPNLESASPIIALGPEEAAPTPPSAAPPPSVPDRRGSGVLGQPRSGMLTAGDHDDLLNPELYADYVGKYLQSQPVSGVPFVDTRRVLTVTVQDRAGRPVPFAEVRLTCADGNSLSLQTLADGSAAFFPALDRLGNRVRLTVLQGGRIQNEAREIAITGDSGAQRHNVTLPGAARPVTRFDLAIVLDTTGSMGDEIEFLKNELHSIVAYLRREHVGLDLRLALVAYRDEGDIFVTRTYPFSGSVEEMQRRLGQQSGDGGGDYPEAMDQALGRAMTLDWRPDSVRSLMLVADAPPHEENVAKTWLIAEAARARRIQITPVAASGVADLAEYMMRAMAAATQSRYLFLTDDSGIGNPHAPPAVDCYLVTKLETLIRRVLDGQISGRRVEPVDEEVIRSVGQYENGRCILPPDFKVQEIEPRNQDR
jgi:hypothetical protein